MAITEDCAISPLSSHTGAEVYGVDLTQPINTALSARLNRCLRRRMPFWCSGISICRHSNCWRRCELFGEIFPQHNTALRACPNARRFITSPTRTSFEDGRAYIPGEGYHTDHSNDAEPPKATALHAVKLPINGGDTQFVNMCAAYDELPAATSGGSTA